MVYRDIQALFDSYDSDLGTGRSSSTERNGVSIAPQTTPDHSEPTSPLQSPTFPSPSPLGDPPRYRPPRRPTSPVTFTFSPLSSNSMLLVPSSSSSDIRPPYHISVRHNCFMPLSYITTIRRGDSEDGELVADFEMGLSDMPSTLCIGGNETEMDHVFFKGNRHGEWIWKSSRTSTAPIRWDCTPQDRICFQILDVKGRVPMARFIQPKKLRRRGGPARLSKLEVFPDGHDLLDEILVSALILERKRLTPTKGDVKYRLW